MEEFKSNMKSLAKRAATLKETIFTEEATKTSLIMPFFQVLGYDVFNPQEFLPEFTADVGIKKGEKVDYAIMQNGEPIILIEAKSINEPIEKHDSQLFRYFGATSAKFAILTNGIEYRFFTDLVEQNKMDSTPFFTVDFSNLKDNQLTELAKFKKSNFDLDHILDTASELKYTTEIKNFLSQEFEKPSDDFVSYILSHTYEGRKTQSVLEKFNGIVKQSLKQFLNEIVNDKLQAALKNTSSGDAEANGNAEIDDDSSTSQKDAEEIVTTSEELEGYVTVKLLLANHIDEDRISYRDNRSYFNVLIDDNIRKWVCRLYLTDKKRQIVFNDEERTTIPLEKISEIRNYEEKLVDIAESFV